MNQTPKAANGVTPRVQSIPQRIVYFEYVGRTGLTVQGPITGKRYRFAGPGTRAAIDGRDAPSLSGVPNLKRAKKPY